MARGALKMKWPFPWLLVLIICACSHQEEKRFSFGSVSNKSFGIETANIFPVSNMCTGILLSKNEKTGKDFISGWRSIHQSDCKQIRDLCLEDVTGKLCWDYSRQSKTWIRNDYLEKK